MLILIGSCEEREKSHPTYNEYGCGSLLEQVTGLKALACKRWDEQLLEEIVANSETLDFNLYRGDRFPAGVLEP